MLLLYHTECYLLLGFEVKVERALRYTRSTSDVGKCCIRVSLIFEHAGGTLNDCSLGPLPALLTGLSALRHV